MLTDLSFLIGATVIVTIGDTLMWIASDADDAGV